MEAADEVLDFIEERGGGGGIDTFDRLVKVLVVSGSACLPFLLVTWAVFEEDNRVWDGRGCLRFDEGDSGADEVFLTGSVLDLVIPGSIGGLEGLVLSIEENRQ